MNRLTARTEKGLAYLVNVKPDEQEVDSPYKNTLQCILDCFERLAHYEDLEEQGRLVVLPCKVGDKVYNLTSDSPSGIEETKVFQIRLTKSSYRALCNCVYDDWGSARWEFGPNDFGKTVFLTRAEAEAALKGAEHERD